MSDTVIKAENISKKYNLVHKAEGKSDSLMEAASSLAKNILRSRKGGDSRETFWALQEINFEVKQGDRVGIIGRNGAGKSTLLKVLSRVVLPTTGRIEYTGRMASLLEVGTGFHGDLSGRENIYLNGSILGMSRREISNRFDEIVAFSEIEKFIDTPVKRYSSGMYVRLAFAIAAHLEPEILIVDEVLAVGDAAFQKKCLGKMEDVSSKEGRTILFVSHNMGQIAALCNKGILLEKGRIVQNGSIKDVVGVYHNRDKGNDVPELVFPDSDKKEYYIKAVSLHNTEGLRGTTFAHDEKVCLNIEVGSNANINDVNLSVQVSDAMDRRVFTAEHVISGQVNAGRKNTFQLSIPANFLTPNTYSYSVALHIPNIQLFDEHRNAGEFTVFDNGSPFYKYQNVDNGCVFVNAEWKNLG